jgi:hypothetical protein
MKLKILKPEKLQKHLYVLNFPFFKFIKNILSIKIMEYEYDPKMEETYRRSLIKLVRKSIDDRFYPFLIVDQNNEQLGHFRDVADYAEANQFQVYFVELNNDPQSCLQRNIHNRSLSDIQQVNFILKKHKILKLFLIDS